MNGYAVTLCPDGGEPLVVREAIMPVHHVRGDGAACFTPDDDCGFAGVWRRPTAAELADYLDHHRLNLCGHSNTDTR